MVAELASVSAVLAVLKIPFKKDTEKILLQVKGLIQIIVKFRAEKFFVRFYHSPKILLMGTKYRASKQ